MSIHDTSSHPATEQQIDETAVAVFARKMMCTMAESRAKGKSGWHDKDRCDSAWLSELLYAATATGDLVSIANYAMMLHQRGEALSPPTDPRLVLLHAARLIEDRYMVIDQVRRNSGDPDLRGHAADFIADADSLLNTCKTYIASLDPPKSLPNSVRGPMDALKAVLPEAIAALRAEGRSIDLVNRLEAAFAGVKRPLGV